MPSRDGVLGLTPVIVFCDRFRTMTHDILLGIAEMAHDVFTPPWKSVVDWILRLGTPVVLGLSGFIIGDVTKELDQVQKASAENTVFIKEMKAVEYNINDAMRTQQKTYEQVDQLKRMVGDLERRIPTRTEFESLIISIRDLREDVREMKQ